MYSLASISAWLHKCGSPNALDCYTPKTDSLLSLEVLSPVLAAPIRLGCAMLSHETQGNVQY